MTAHKDQRALAQDVIAKLLDTPEAPAGGRYLSLERAATIVDETIAHVLHHSDAVEHKYLVGHRRRLATSLSMIPMAERDDAVCLDVGCYGYMGLWASQHLGYARVHGIELRPDREDPTLIRLLEMGGHRLEMVAHNFDLAQVAWPIETIYDTILFFETLEHVATDPMAVLLNIAKRMHERSTLVMSVPNAVSHKTLQEFLMGAPPWVYWFFHPDLRHEPRHCFEYTPIFLKLLLRSAGFEEAAFRTICAFADRESLNDVFEIGAALSVDPALFGETMIVQARRVSDTPLFRYPDCIYDGDSYYRTTYPLLEPALQGATRSFLERWRAQSSSLSEAEARAQVAEAKVAEALASYERCLLQGDELRQRVSDAERRADEARAQAEAADARVAEALFICERYLAREEEMFQRASGAEKRATQAEAHYEAIVRSASWRVTEPARRLAQRFPSVRSRVRSPFRRGAA